MGKHQVSNGMVHHQMPCESPSLDFASPLAPQSLSELTVEMVSIMSDLLRLSSEPPSALNLILYLFQSYPVKVILTVFVALSALKCHFITSTFCLENRVCALAIKQNFLLSVSGKECLIFEAIDVL